jgi:uncharacterized protein with FMN-binding domain
MAQSTSNKKVANSLVALSSAAVLAVYSAGYVRTKAAAERFAEQSSDRRAPRQAPAPSAQILTASLNTASPNLLPEPKSDVPVAPKPADEPKAVKAAATEASSTPSAAPGPVPAVTSVATPVVTAPTPAPAPVVAAAPAAPLTPPQPWKDGIWKGWGTCRHGDIQAAVKIENGKITQAGVADCQTRYSCDIIDKLPPEVVQRQTADVDRVGGATQSADAFYFAVYDALRQAHEAAKADPSAAQPQAN